MNILLIGGSKFLGYHLSHALLDHNFQVTIFNRGRTKDDFGDGVERVIGDRKEYQRFYDIFRGRKFDAVIDLIGYDLEDVVVSERTFRDHIGRYIFISTGQVYLVTQNKNLPAKEEDFHQDLIPCPAGEEAAYGYGVSKRKIEIFLQEQYASHKFPVVSLRCPVIHGSRDYTLRLYSYLLRIQDKNPLIIPKDGDSIIRHIYVQDVVKAILTILTVSEIQGEAYNLAQKEVLILSEFLNVLGSYLNKQIKIVKVPISELTKYNLSEDLSPFSGRWISYLDPTKAENELEFDSTPIEKWVPEVIDYFFEEYQGPIPENYHYRDWEIQLTNNFMKPSEIGF